MKFDSSDYGKHSMICDTRTTPYLKILVYVDDDDVIKSQEIS